MILKAGTYRFNDVPTETYPLTQSFDFTLIVTYDGEVSEEAYTGIVTELIDDGYYRIAATFSTGYIAIYLNPVPDYEFAEMYANGWMGGSAPSVRIDKDTEVADDFGTWFIESTNYNDVNAKPLAEITYNGETIAQLNSGETATLSCEGKKMASDVVVKVNEVESKIPEGYVKPEGTLQVVSNNTTVDVTNYAKIAVRTAKPREIETESQFNAILSDSSGITGTSAGDVFMYIGETTDSYESGALYYLEDTEK